MKCLLMLLWLFTAPLYAAVTVTDDLGQTLELAQPAHRIVSLAPYITELLFAAGAGASVVGASEYSDFPPRANAIPRVGGAGGIDPEAVAALQPDLVIAWESGNPMSLLQRLRILGLPVFHSEPRSLADIPRTLSRFARLAGNEAAAQPAIAAYTRRLDHLQQQYSGRAPVSVFYQVWDQPLMTINGKHIASAVIDLCGGSNVFADQAVLAPEVSLEAVLARDPEVILIAADQQDDEALVAAWQRWPHLRAVHGGHVYTVQRELLTRHTPRILDGADLLCGLLDQIRSARK